MRATYRPGTRRWLLLAAAVLALSGLAAGCSSSKPAYCTAASQLKTSVHNLGNITINIHDLSSVNTAVSKVSSDATTFASEAKSAYPSQTTALKNSLSSLDDRDQGRTGPAFPDHDRSGRASGHASEDLGEQPAKCRKRKMPVTSARRMNPEIVMATHGRPAGHQPSPGRHHAARGGSVARRDQEGAPQMAKWNFVAMGQVGLTGWTKQLARPVARSIARRTGRPEAQILSLIGGVFLAIALIDFLRESSVIAAGRTGPPMNALHGEWKT